MSEYPVRVAQQLPALLQAFRKQAGFTQAEAAARLGITQQTLSALERNASQVSVSRLLRLLGVLDVELVLRPRAASPKKSGAAAPQDRMDW